MKINIKFTEDDQHGFKNNKFIKYTSLIVGSLLFLLGAGGLIIDLFFPTFSATYHTVAGPDNWGRLLAGAMFLTIFWMLRK